MTYDGAVIIDTRLNTKGVSTGVAGLKSQFLGLSAVVKKLGGIIGVAFSVRAIVQFGKEAIELGSDLQEVQNVVDVTFTTMNENVNEFARNAAATAGLSETMAKRYVGTFGAMAKSFKFTEAEAYEMSTSLTQLAGDVASFYNLSQDAAYTKLKSVFTGETESLKDLGVVMTQTALDSYALANGFGKTTDSMTEQEKVALRYRFVMDQLAGASGDFVRTSDSWANQTRLLKLQFDQLKATIGQGLINAFTPVIKVLNAIISRLQVLAESFRQFTVALFGEAGGGSSSVATNLGEAADSAGELASGVEKAGKKAKKALAPFDEMNKLTDDAAASSDASAGADAGIGSIGIGAVAIDGEVQDGISPKLQALADKIHKVLEPLKAIDFGPLKQSLRDLGERFGGLGAAISDGLQWAWENILVPLAGWTIQDALPEFMNVAGAAAYVMTEALQALSPLLTWLWEEFLQPVAQWTGQAIIDGLQWLSEKLTAIGDWISANQQAVETIAIVVGAFAAAWALVNAAIEIWNVISVVATAVTKALGAAVNFLLSPIGLVVVAIGALIAIVVLLVKNWDTVKETAAQVWAKIVDIWKSVSTWFNDNVVQPVKNSFSSLWTSISTAASNAWNGIKGIWTAVSSWFSTNIIQPVKNFFSGLWSTISSAASTAWGAIKGVWSAASSWFNATLIQPVKNFFAGMWDKLKSGASAAWQGVKNVFSSVGDFFKNIFSNAWSKVVGVFSSAGNIFTNIKDGILTAFKSIVNKIIAGINNVVAIPFNGINTALRAVKNISIFGLQPFSKINTISVPKIPYLAQGAVIPPNAPFMAVLGDQRRGTNIEAPLSTIQEAVALVMGDMTGGMMAGFEATVAVLREILEAILGIEIGDTVIAEAVNRYNRKMAVARGGA